MGCGTLRELFTEELRTLVFVETQVVKAIPVLAKTVFTKELSETLIEDAAKTKGYVVVLRSFVSKMGAKRTKSDESAVKSILSECSTIRIRFVKGKIRDAAMLSVLQGLEHYRTALYSTALALAKQLGEQAALDLLHEGGRHDDLAAKKFAQIAIQVNAEAFIDTHSERCNPSLN